ncbi:hypothetical protein NLI96_g4952 [Meripilus lineatus]|uniref:Glutaredoxin domain-containing protein n=1 Tax=Meripilus lineatus TaxID=2056292 RepID=A0AAD5YEB6_9APHY|nr:hypothetical protein NLI96_g4952 [Physisporinus lineatus]
MAAKDLVENAISGNTITVFSKTWCPYCRRAKALLSQQFPDIQTQILELDTLDEGSDIQDYLQQKTGQRSVPNIFINPLSALFCNLSQDGDELVVPAAATRRGMRAILDDHIPQTDRDQSTISSDQLVIFSKTFCPFSKRVKAMFAESYPSIQPKVIEIDEVENGAAIQDYLGEKTGQKTVPNVFISFTPDGNHIGGCDDTLELHSSGKLGRLLDG